MIAVGHRLLAIDDEMVHVSVTSSETEPIRSKWEGPGSY